MNLSRRKVFRLTLPAALKAKERDETIRVMTRFVPQSAEFVARSYDAELKALAKDGTMTDAEITFQMERLSDKRRALDEVRDFPSRGRRSKSWRPALTVRWAPVPDVPIVSVLIRSASTIADYFLPELCAFCSMPRNAPA